MFLFFTFLEHDLCSPTWLESHATFDTIKTHKHTNTAYNTPVPTQGRHVIPVSRVWSSQEKLLTCMCSSSQAWMKHLSEGIQTKHWQKILRRYNRFVFLIFNLAPLLSGYWLILFCYLMTSSMVRPHWRLTVITFQKWLQAPECVCLFRWMESFENNPINCKLWNSYSILPQDSWHFILLLCGSGI